VEVCGSLTRCLLSSLSSAQYSEDRDGFLDILPLMEAG